MHFFMCSSHSLRRSARLQQQADSHRDASPAPSGRHASPVPCNSQQHEDVVRYVCVPKTSNIIFAIFLIVLP